VEPWGKDPMCLDQKEQNLMISVSVEPKLNFLQLVFCWFSISKLSGTRVVLRCFFFQFQLILLPDTDGLGGMPLVMLMAD
jgi:hypothetical protein